jgi:hypothetical protein
MINKHPVCPQRLRKIPKQFSWVDHRLVRDHHIERCSHRAAALYLFLVTVGDAQGLSYYSDLSIAKRLAMDQHSLAQARQELIDLGLIAYQNPLYQVLSLDTVAVPATRSAGHAQSLGEILKHIVEDAS